MNPTQITQLIDAFQASYAPRCISRKYILERARILRQLITHAKVETPADLTLDRIAESLNTLQKRLSRKTVHGYGQAARCFAGWLHANGHTPTHQLADLRLRTGDRPLFRRGSAELAPSLSELVDAFRTYVGARDVTAKHEADTADRVRAVLKAAKAESVDDVTEPRIAVALGEMRKSIEGASGLARVTVNHYCRAVKSFAKWLWRSGFTDHHRLAELRLLNERISPRHPRRPLNPIECTMLIQAAAGGPDSYNMPPSARAMLYRVALSSGFRSNELRALKVGDVQRTVDGGVRLHLSADVAKARRSALQPLPAWTAAKLLEFIDGRKPTDPLFAMPPAPNVVRMLRADLKRAQIPYRTSEGIADFHALRHTFLTQVSLTTNDPELLKRAGRLSSIQIATRYYVHRDSSALAQVVAALPDLTSTEARA